MKRECACATCRKIRLNLPLVFLYISFNVKNGSFHFNSHCVQIIECRTFLKQYWDDGELGDFIEESVDRQHARLYAAEDAAPPPAVDALAYLDKETYSDDEWVEEVEVEEGAKEEKEKEKNVVVGVVKDEAATQQMPADFNDGIAAAATTTLSGDEDMIMLSDSEDEVDNDDEEEEEKGQSPVPAPASLPRAPAPAPVAVVMSLQERQRAQEAEKVRIELQRRKARFFAAQAQGSSRAPANSRAALLTSLRSKVHQTAKENYCSQKKIQTEQLAVRLQIAEKCRYC